MTKTIPPSKNTTEFTVHVGGDTAYDYRFITEKREEIMNIIKRVYHFNKTANVPVYHTDAKDLRTYTTTEKDWKSGRTNFPPQNLRAPEEDIFQGTASTETTEDDSNTFENEQSLAAASGVRAAQIKGGQNLSAEESGEDELDTQTKESMANGGQSVFARDGKPPANLQDFEIVKMIGKGTFGKVFLVKQKTTEALFAMKCIRKDIVL